MRISWTTVVLQASAVTADTYFHHRSRQASVVIGTTLYWDGGELAQWNKQGNGFANGSTITNVKDTSTYYIDLTSSWNGATANIVSFSKDEPPSLQSQALWADNDQQAFAYDGGISLAGPVYDDPPGNQLWALNPKASSRWSQQSPSGNFSLLSRVSEGSYASGNGLGFALGGVMGGGTAKNTRTYRPPGMVMYNMTSKVFFNVSAGGDYSQGSQNGVAQLVTNFGTNGTGILVALAGMTAGGSMIAMDRVTLFDPVTQQWTTQTVTGDIPQPVLAPCLVGAPGDNGTYELFLYGGLQQPPNSAPWTFSDGSVYILSLPAFNWIRVETNATGRWRHSCNVAGPSSRQMISIGGIVVPGPLNNTPAVFTTFNDGAPDPWANGLRVFDMTKLKWGPFNQPSDDYVTPDPVKAYYQKQGLYPSSWDDPATRRWFTVKATNNNSSSNSNNNQSTSSSSGVNAGAIAGGVVGGVAAIAIIAVIVWLVLRRRKAKRVQHAAPDPAPSYVTSYAPTPYAEPKYSPVNNNPPASELQADHIRELDSGVYHQDAKTASKANPSQIAELEGHRHEMP